MIKPLSYVTGQLLITELPKVIYLTIRDQVGLLCPTFLYNKQNTASTKKILAVFAHIESAFA